MRQPDPSDADLTRHPDRLDLTALPKYIDRGAGYRAADKYRPVFLQLHHRTARRSLCRTVFIVYFYAGIQLSKDRNVAGQYLFAAYNDNGQVARRQVHAPKDVDMRRSQLDSVRGKSIREITLKDVRDWLLPGEDTQMPPTGKRAENAGNGKIKR